jgi:hypothetical protein
MAESNYAKDYSFGGESNSQVPRSSANLTEQMNMLLNMDNLAHLTNNLNSMGLTSVALSQTFTGSGVQDPWSGQMSSLSTLDSSKQNVFKELQSLTYYYKT